MSAAKSGGLRYVAFLRGVSPANAKMADLKSCFERLGFTDVRTLLSSGNVAFTGAAKDEARLVAAIESALAKDLPRGFPVIVRRRDALVALLATDPFAGLALAPGAKRVVTFLAEPPAGTLALPLERDGATIVAMDGREVFTAYVPNARGPMFMTLIEKTLGKNVTTRTWDTVGKCARA